MVSHNDIMIYKGNELMTTFHKWKCLYFYGTDENENYTYFYEAEGVINILSASHLEHKVDFNSEELIRAYLPLV